jgi:hypothetical protein
MKQGGRSKYKIKISALRGEKITNIKSKIFNNFLLLPLLLTGAL